MRAAANDIGLSPPDEGLLPLRFDRHELAGSVGDIGVMIPLAGGVATVAHLSLVTRLSVRRGELCRHRAGLPRTACRCSR